MARRPASVRTIVRAAQRRRAETLQLALRRALGMSCAGEQLELGITRASAPPCAECGRWNYHLMSCSQHPSRRSP